MRRHQTREDVVTEIREILAAIEYDLEPFLRGDAMNYTGYLAENADDLNTLIQGLLGEMRNE
jgi:hypothetical protein